jgi:hypothetical protein
MVAVAYAGESALKPGSQGAQSTETPGALNPGGAYGIWSLNGPLQASLDTFAKRMALPVDAVDTQLYWLLNECASDARYAKVWQAIQAGTPYEQFIPIFVEVFEVPKEPGPEIARSVAFAKELDAEAPTVSVPAPAMPAAPAPIAQSAAPQSEAMTMEAALAVLIPILAPLAQAAAPLLEAAIMGGIGGALKHAPTLPVFPVLPPVAAGGQPATLADFVAELLKQLQDSKTT